MPRPKLRNDALRERVLHTAIAVLERDGPVALRARNVASAAGTSTAALYELFGDKGGLVRAMFYDGFRVLLDRLSAVPDTADPRHDLIATLAASRRFAVENPMLFELMYARRYGEFEPTPDDLSVGKHIYELIVRRVVRWLDAGGSSVDAVDAAHALVALNRGLIAAELAGIQGRSQASTDRRWTLAVDAQLDGLHVQPARIEHERGRR